LVVLILASRVLMVGLKLGKDSLKLIGCLGGLLVDKIEVLLRFDLVILKFSGFSLDFLLSSSSQIVLIRLNIGNTFADTLELLIQLLLDILGDLEADNLEVSLLEEFIKDGIAIFVELGLGSVEIHSHLGGVLLEALEYLTDEKHSDESKCSLLNDPNTHKSSLSHGLSDRVISKSALHFIVNSRGVLLT
jgi:hypothetical protein